MAEPDPEPIDIEAGKLEERLKSALWFSIGKIVDSETINLGVNATPQFIGSLTELVWTQIENTALDLESFAKHGKRSTIQTDDVLLLARRNEGLESILKDFVERLRRSKLKDREGEGEEEEGGVAKGNGNGNGNGRGNAKKGERVVGGARGGGSGSGRGRESGRGRGRGRRGGGVKCE